MEVARIMIHKPPTVKSTAKLRLALELMDKHGHRYLPVVSADNHLIGIISNRNCRVALHLPVLQRELWETHEAIDRLRIRDVMTPAPIVAEPHMAVQDAVSLMLNNHVGCLPVMRCETLVGIVTVADVLAYLGGQHPEAITPPEVLMR